MTSHEHNIFGYYHLPSLFREVLRFEDSGFVYKNKLRISWNEIFAFRSYPNFQWDLVFSLLRSAYPRLTIYLKDGSVVKVDGVVRGKCDVCRSKKTVNGISDDYVELVDKFRSKDIPKWNGPKDETVFFKTLVSFQLFGWLIGFIRAQPIYKSSFSSVFLAAAELALIMSVVGILAGIIVTKKVRKVYILGNLLYHGEKLNHG